MTASANGDSLVGTALNDLFIAPAGTLQNADTILDSSTTDHDIMNAEVTIATLAPRIQNVETINVTGKYTTTGINLTSVAGTNDLNVNTNIAGGTATVDNAASINAKNINAGSKVSTLNVTATASGTRDTVNVDAGSATLNLEGGAALDMFNATTTGNVNLGVNANGDATTANFTAIDSVTLNLSDAATTITGDAKLGSLTINQTGTAGVITVASGKALTEVVATAATAKTTITGDQDVTIKVANADVSGTAIVDSSTGTTKLSITNSATGIVLKDAKVDVVALDFATATGKVTVNADSKVELNTAVTGDVTLQVAATTAETALANGSGTLLLDVNKTQTAAIITDTAVGTVILNAGVDATAAAGAKITMSDLQMGVNTNTVVIQGAEDLVLSKLTMNATTADVMAATEMTGDLTVSTTVGAGTQTLHFGSGNDTLTNTGAATVLVNGNAGNDKITITAALAGSIVNGGDGDDTIVANTAGGTFNGDAGNDTITGAAAVDTINGGTGNDTIDGKAGADKITLGAGTDTVLITNGEDGDVIADFVIGEDTLVLLGTGNATSLDLSAMTVASGVYSAGTNHDFTFTGSTATDLSSAIQLGKQKAGTTGPLSYFAAANATIKAGSLNDHITQGAGTLTLDAGAGDDVIVTTGANAATLTGGAGNDTFTVDSSSTALVDIKDLSAGDILIVGAGNTNVTAAVTTDFTATAASMQSSTGTIADVVLTLNDGINIDMTLATITGALGYTISTIGTATVGSTIVGSRSADTITGSKFADTITGGEGADTITAGKGADTIILTESVSAIDTVIVTAQKIADGLDTIVDFRGGVDVLKTGITPATAAFTDMTSTTLSTTSYATLALAAQGAVNAAQTVLAGNYATAGDAITFVYDSKTYLLVNAGTDSTFDDGSDVMVELVGLDGTLAITDIIA